MKSVHFPQLGGISSEQQLVQNLVDEQIKLFGMDVYYVPKQMIIDRTMNDVVLNEFKEFYMIEMMLINVEGFGGSGAVAMSKFGLRLSDEIIFAVSKKRFQDTISKILQLTVQDRPNEGDLLYVPMTKNLYEIKFVEREVPFYQLGKNYIFSLTCELIENANNYFNTGNSDIDNYSQEAHVFPVEFKAGGIGNYRVGETVTQTYEVDGETVVVTAKVADWNSPSRKLRLTYINGILREDLPLVGEDSEASWIVDKFSTIDFQIDNYENAENLYYEEQADLILDFSETNPFGEYGDMEDSF
jgi:hypothetical protein